MTIIHIYKEGDMSYLCAEVNSDHLLHNSFDKPLGINAEFEVLCKKCVRIRGPLYELAVTDL